MVVFDPTQLAIDLQLIFDLQPSDLSNVGVISEVLSQGIAHPNELEQVLVNRLSSWQPSDPPLIKYLFKCYERVSKLPNNSQLSIECKYFVVSYAGLVLLMPSMFQASERLEALGAGLLGKMLLEKFEAIPQGFLGDLIARYEGQESFVELIEGIIGFLLENCRGFKILDPCGSLFATLEYLISFQPVAEALPKLSCWWPEGLKAEEIGAKSLLGGLFSVMPTHKTLDELLPMREQSNPADMNNAYAAVRLACSTYASQMHSFLLKGIKSGPVLKEAIINFLAKTASLNGDRAKMRYDARTVSSDGLVMGIFRVLLKFCDPFLGPNNSKSDLINLFYYETCDRLPIDQFSKINMTDAEYAGYKKEVQANAHAAPNFISDMFYLTLQYFRISYVAMVTSIDNMSRIRQELQSHLEYINEELRKSPGNMLHKMQHKRAADQLAYIENSLRLGDMTLLDPELVEQVYLVICLVLSLMLKMAEAGPMGELPAVPEKRFLSLPEHFLETTNEVLMFLSRTFRFLWNPNRPIEPLVRFMATFLDRPDYIKNPYLRSKFIDIMHGWANADNEYIFDLYPIMAENLAGSLMRFYIEVERTGASSQFYDKFNIRYAISVILRCIWEHPIYRAKLKEAAKERDTVIHFINFILNDVSFLLDEAMMKLTDIHNYQEELERGAIASLPEEERKARDESFRKTEGMCKAYAQLGGETLQLLAYLTKLIQEPFLQDEVIDHFSAMLNYNLVHLTGPKCRELRVKHPEKYFFNPRTWLGNLVQIFLSFTKKERFLQALARDGRSFQVDTFQKAAGLIGRLGLGTEADATEFSRMIERVQAIQQQGVLAEEELGDIPEEFLDPLMATLMEDPVILTTSGTTVDRKTITAHLLNHKIDPFNRMPITMDQIIPNTELKQSIDQFLKQKRNQK